MNPLPICSSHPIVGRVSHDPSEQEPHNPWNIRLDRRAVLISKAAIAGIVLVGMDADPASAASVQMLWPNGGTTMPQVTSGFGPRPVTIPGASANHLGTDFIGYTTVRAVAAGTVSYVGWRGGWSGGGYMVWVQHDGFLSRSLHLADGSAVVQQGQRVDLGDPLATMGGTGIGGGVHHHLEIAPGSGAQVDPVPFISSRINATPVPHEPQWEDDMYDAAARDALFRKIENDTRPIRLYTWGTGIIAVGPGGREWIVPSQAYIDLLVFLRLSGPDSVKIDDNQKGFLKQISGLLNPDPNVNAQAGGVFDLSPDEAERLSQDLPTSS